jgi:ankyrin repeat protein
MNLYRNFLEDDEMRNAYNRLKEELPEDAFDVVMKLSAAIREDDANLLSHIIDKYFSKAGTVDFLSGEIAYDGKESPLCLPAFLAVISGSQNALRIILEHTRNPNERRNPDTPENSPTLLMQAIGINNLDMVKLLLGEGADVNEEWEHIGEDGEKIGPTSVLFGAVHQGLIKTANFLLDNGAIPTFFDALAAIRTSDGVDPLLVKMIELRPELVQLQFQVQQIGYCSLLHMAAMRNNLPSIKLLLDQGANLNAIAKDGRTPLDWAIYAEKKEISAFLQSVGGVSGKRDDSPALQNPSPTKQEITKIIERLELLEEKFGIAISGLYANYETGNPAFPHIVKINFDLSSLSGGKLERSFKMLASAYNSAGQLLQTESIRIDADDFMGFSPVSITLYHLDQAPEKIRLFPAA